MGAEHFSKTATKIDEGITAFRRHLNEQYNYTDSDISRLEDEIKDAKQTKVTSNRGLEKFETKEEPPISSETSSNDLSLVIASLQAQLDLKRQAYAKRPRRYTISSASTRRHQDALYLNNWRRRIEAVGNINYQAEARSQQIYGSLRMLVALLPDGQVDEIRILQSSDHSVLDDAAVEIVHLAAPFDPFPEAIRAEADILEIVRTWRFHEGNALTSF